MRAAAWSNTAMVRLLLDKRANLEAADTVTAAFDSIRPEPSYLWVGKASINIYHVVSFLQFYHGDESDTS